MPDLMDRYLNGEHIEVWNELRSHNPKAAEQEAAWLVATETMRRVARNADRLAARLDANGWKSLGGALRTPTAETDKLLIQRIETATGAPLPISLHAFWLNVGGIDFVWDYNSTVAAPDLIASLEMDDMDPMCVYSPASIDFEITEWEESDEFRAPFRVPLAPDYLHKINVSGGDPYGVDLPFYGFDPIFREDRHALPFVDYLRLCFRFAGFPRLEQISESDSLRNFLNLWTGDLEEF